MGAAWNAELYSDDDSSSGGLCFAGCLLYYLVRNHCFVDGNKRVGWVACMEVLPSLGLTLDATDEEVEAFVTAIAANSPDVASALDVPVWLAPRLRAL